VSARLLCGAAVFFFASFVFAYFYLRTLDLNKGWKIGAVHPSIGLGIAVAVLLIVSAVLLRMASARHGAGLREACLALLMATIAVVLQIVEWFTLGFGGASGGYASVFIGWTITYVVLALCCLYWIETQVATLWRVIREGPGPAGPQIAGANLEACSFFWTFYVGIGVLAFVILYLL
jgi:heme/copper-type cytochrome/quinol oxidase subunit 3